MAKTRPAPTLPVAETVEELAEALQDFTDCPLHEQSGKLLSAVPGVGPSTADYMIVGEAPGSTEDRQGEPFVGPSGEKLMEVMRLAGLYRFAVRLTNVERFRPPGNRKPKKSETDACGPWLLREIQLVRPKVVVALGGTAAKFFDKKISLNRDHGKARPCTVAGHTFILIPTYHPAFALRNPAAWSVLVEDFMALRSEVASAEVGAAPAIAPHYELASDEEAAQIALSVGQFAFDLETTSPQRGGKFDVGAAEIVGYSIAWAEGQAVYVSGKPDKIRQALESVAIEKVCHNTKFEYRKLKQIGITLTNFHDTKLAAWLLQHHSTHLKALTRQLLGRDPLTFDDVTGGRDFSELTPDEALPYAAADSDNTLMLWQVLRNQLLKADLYALYEEVELPLIPVLSDMEEAGTAVDVEGARKILEEIDEQVGAVRAEANRLLADRAMSEQTLWDVSSTQQLAEALDYFKAPITKRTAAKRQLSTADDELLVARGWWPELIDAVLHFRTLVKMRAYAKSYIELAGEDGRLHPQFVQTGYGEEAGGESSAAPVTGRLSCRDPNLQNQPKRKGGEWTARLRRCLVARPGHVFVEADISQEEVRIAAYVTGDAPLLAALASGKNLYEEFSEGIYQQHIGKHSDPLEYNVGKQSILSFIWGSAGAHAWCPRLLELDREQGSGQLTEKSSREAYARLESKHMDIKAWRGRVRAALKEKGYIVDCFGRRRLCPGIYHSNRQLQDAAWREAMNFLIQAPAASVMKRILVRVADFLTGAKLESRIVLSVHDSVVLECPVEEVAVVREFLSRVTKGLMAVELPVEVGQGPNLAEIK